MAADWLNLPEAASPSRVLGAKSIAADRPTVLADLEGPGCIRRIFVVTTRHPTPAQQRQIVLRMYWDGASEPAVEAPIGDFFGQLHGVKLYPLNSRYLVTQFHSGYTASFPMPFERSARIEVEAGPDVDNARILYTVDWHRYPVGDLHEPLRFHAQFRREFPCQAYGRNYTILDAVGRGRFLGFNYGVRVYDDRARWSHAGAESIYVANDVDSRRETFVHLRGAGGEDTFGASFGGVLHRPSSHLDQGVPYYVHEDAGPALARHRLAAYRFFEADSIAFERSIQVRFGSMANDICSTAYWYQAPPQRRFVRLPDWDLLLPGSELPFGACEAVDETPRWWLFGPFHPDRDAALDAALPSDDTFDPSVRHTETGYAPDSPWRRDGRGDARWVRHADIDGFVDFALAFRPIATSNSLTFPALALGQTWLHVDANTAATMHLGWVNELRLRVNDEPWRSLGRHAYFRTGAQQVRLRRGANRLQIKLDNPATGRAGDSWGSWVFAVRVVTDSGREVTPSLSAG